METYIESLVFLLFIWELFEFSAIKLLFYNFYIAFLGYDIINRPSYSWDRFTELNL